MEPPPMTPEVWFDLNEEVPPLAQFRNEPVDIS